MPAPVRFAKSLLPLMQPIDSVSQHPDNPRNGDIDKIIESIRVNGFLVPITVHPQTRHIISGNHRWQALHALGATEVPVVWFEGDDEAALRFLIGDNATNDAAMNDPAQLARLLGQLQETDMGLAGTAISPDEYQALLMDLSQTEIPDGGGFGQPAPLGLYQVVVEFDNEDDMHDLAAELIERDLNVREVNL